jgi:fumarate reductase flavoprotein subunit
VGIHGANRLGSNSLAELCVFGKVAGEEAAKFAKSVAPGATTALHKQAEVAQQRAMHVVHKGKGTERLSVLRREMAETMERGCGIFRMGDEMQRTCDKLAELRQRFKNVNVEDKSRVFNTEWLLAIELGYQLEVAQAMAVSALNRKESRGAHQRLDGFTARDDVNYLKHSLATYAGEDMPAVTYGSVNITHSQPAVRAYGAAGEKAEAAAAGGKSV